MIEFKYKGIEIEATVEMERYDYKDDNNIRRTRYDRNVSVSLCFYGFVISNDLYELAMVKSTLQYFMQAYWKRKSRQGTKIELATSLEHNNYGIPQSLNLTAKQKNNIQSLEISMTENGQRVSGEYLSAQEVIMLDIAISKAIALLTPQTVYIVPRLSFKT